MFQELKSNVPLLYSINDVEYKMFINDTYDHTNIYISYKNLLEHLSKLISTIQFLDINIYKFHNVESNVYKSDKLESIDTSTNVYLGLKFNDENLKSNKEELVNKIKVCTEDNYKSIINYQLSGILLEEKTIPHLDESTSYYCFKLKFDSDTLLTLNTIGYLYLYTQIPSVDFSSKIWIYK